ncbi:hypothetical protein DYB32_003268 [Aphanomyces invadans]|uniref:Uncharacterized protein n=1 Tax=Aphanomyces invadans TaxID=157072 RepID=A0A418B6S7_9STRA|nr:hypothetical protein DYB32_003268 [Aphanomyces invadans]
MAMAQLHDDTSNNAASMNKQRTIRIMVLGDEKVGKSSLISALVSQHASERVPRVLHDIVIPTEDTRDNVVISLHDTSSSSNDVMEVIKTMNRSDAAIVVYDVSRSISSQRLGYWLDLLKVTKVVPVVLVGNKSDLLPGGSEISRVQSVLRNYKFIVHTLECSARTLTNVKKTFGLAQKAVLYPMAPLYDAEKKVAVLRTMGYSDTLELEVPLDHIELPQDTAQYEMCEPSAVTLQFLKAVFDQFAPLTPSTVDDIFAITLLTNSSTSFSFLSPEPLSMAFPDGDAKPIQAYQHLLHNVHTIVDKESGVEKTLIITEVSEGVVDYSMVEAIATAIQVDIVCYLFDGTEHDSFEYVGKLQAHGALPFTEKKAAAKKLNDRLFYGGVVAVAAVAAGIAYVYADELQEVGFVKSIVQLWDQTKVKLPALKK